MINSAHLIILANIFSYLLFGPCSCRCKKNETVILIDEETKAYTVFQPNSFWIYDHYPAGIKDTQKLNSVVKWKGQYMFCLPTYEVFKTAGYSSLAQDSVYYELTSENDYGNLYSVYAASLDTSVRNTLPLYFSGSINDSIIEIRGKMATLRLINILDSYQTGSSNFSSVKIFERIPSRFYPSDSLIKIYWAKNIGIIKKEYTGGRFEELIKYDVKQ